MTMGYDFNQLMADMNSYGLSSVLLPFILVFAIVYAVLEKVGPFDRRGVNVVIAFVMGFLVASNTTVVEIIATSLPNVSVILIAILSIILIIGIFGHKIDLAGSSIGGFIAFLSFAVVIIIFGNAAGWIPNLPNIFGFLTNPETRAIIVVFAIFFILIWYITKEDKPAQVGAGFGRVMDEFRKMLK